MNLSALAQRLSFALSLQCRSLADAQKVDEKIAEACTLAGVDITENVIAHLYCTCGDEVSLRARGKDFEGVCLSCGERWVLRRGENTDD